MNDRTHDLGRGLAGTVLYHAVLARDSGQWNTLHTTVRSLTDEPVAVHSVGAGLYRGAPAVAYALHTADHPAFRSALVHLCQALADLVEKRLRDAHRRMDSGELPQMREYDLISGLTGLGALLLHRGTHPALLNEVLLYLVRLLQQPVTFHGEDVPGWWTSDSPSGRPDAAWPTGHGNFGMAHGVAGPIALLALSARAGHTVAGGHQVLTQCCRLLEERTHYLANGGVAWPETITLDDWANGPAVPKRPGRPSWCYGTPGIARALQLAAIACFHTAARHLAEDALTTCASDPEQLARIDNATVCHGWAGLCLTMTRAAEHTTMGSTLRHRLPSLRSRFAAHLAEHPLPDTPGLLTGADGIRLTLHTLNPTHTVSTGWETCLLLS
ncbi:lanthionine synthetase C family protein [Streptomyces sp. DT24]|uniref:lanthionine synthetase C family protein n=1 Tax=Streptomyces sp. DT24 TaxID=3416520 RepID=UPI003CED8B8A